jgi:hypothetical protein
LLNPATLFFVITSSRNCRMLLANGLAHFKQPAVFAKFYNQGRLGVAEF